jgi:hypothetical protein
MAKLKITKADGTESEHRITPGIEVAFENHVKMGMHRAFRDLEMQTHIYYLAWLCLRASGETVKPFTDAGFLDTLNKVEVLDEDPLA